MCVFPVPRVHQIGVHEKHADYRSADAKGEMLDSDIPGHECERPLNTKGHMSVC